MAKCASALMVQALAPTWVGIVTLSMLVAFAVSQVASWLPTLSTMAESVPFLLGTAARYVGPKPALAMRTLSDLASIKATRPLSGFALHSTLPVATGARND